MRLSYAISETFFTSPKTWTIICNLWYFFPFSKNMDHHMQFLEFLSLVRNVDYHMQFMVFVSLLQKHGLSYAICEISFSSPKNIDYRMQFLKFLSLLQKLGLT